MQTDRSSYRRTDGCHVSAPERRFELGEEASGVQWLTTAVGNPA